MTTEPVRKRGKFRWVIVAVAAVFAVAAVVVWRLSTLTQRAQQPRGRFGGAAQPVGVATVGAHDIRVILDEIGTVTPLATITVQPQLSGLLTQLGFKEGQMVKQGDFLAQIDPRPYQAALQQYEGQLMRDEAILQEAQIDLERYERLLHLDSIAKQTYDDQAQVVKQDEGTVRLDQAQVDTQKLNLTYCHITSPVNGRVGIRLVDVGNYIQSTSTTGIVVVTQLDPISIIFSLPEDFVPEVLAQLANGNQLQVAAYDRANVKQLATGTLASVDTQVDTTTGTVKMRALFKNDHNALFPAQFVNVRLLVTTLKGAVAVPQAAVQYGSSGAFAYVLTADNTVKVTPLKLGPQDGDFFAVENGLAAGDRVVTDGTDQLRDGARVTIRSDEPHAGAAETKSGKGSKGGNGAHRRKSGSSKKNSEETPSAAAP